MDSVLAHIDLHSFIVLVLSIVLLYKRTQNYCTFFAFISFHIFYANSLNCFRVFVVLNSSRCNPKSYSLDFVTCHESCEVGFRFILLLNPTLQRNVNFLMTFSLASALINSFPLDQVGVCWSLLVITLLTHHYHSRSEFRPVFVSRLTTLL